MIALEISYLKKKLLASRYHFLNWKRHWKSDTFLTKIKKPLLLSYVCLDFKLIYSEDAPQRNTHNSLTVRDTAIP